MKTQNSVVFVTGANRGLGLAFAHEALRRGAKKIYAGVRSPTEANTPGIVQVKLDVTDPASIAAAQHSAAILLSWSTTRVSVVSPAVPWIQP